MFCTSIILFLSLRPAYQDSPVRCLSEVSYLGLHTNYLHRRTDLAMCLVKTFNKESHLKLFLTCSEMQIQIHERLDMGSIRNQFFLRRPYKGAAAGVCIHTENISCNSSTRIQAQLWHNFGINFENVSVTAVQPSNS